MATKVNVKFVVGLSIVLLGVFGAAAYVGSRTMRKSAVDHAVIAEQAEAEGQWERAAGNWSRAVNKATGNTEYIRRWVNALSKTTPRPSEEYRERYRKDYLLAIQALGDANPTDAAGHRVFLDLILNEAKLLGSQQGVWESIVQRTDAVLRNFPEADKGAAGIRRYRGIARTALMGLTGEQTDLLVAQAKDDLTAAIEGDPEDFEAAASLVDWHRFEAVRARNKATVEAGDALTKQGLAFAAEFLTKHPTASAVLVAEIQITLGEAVRSAAGRGLLMGEVFKQVHPRISQLLDSVLATPKEKVDRNVAWQAAQLALASGLEGGGARGMAALEHVAAADEKDVLTLFRTSELEMATKNYKGAVARLQKLVEMPDIPLSPNGILLFGLREEALARQAECSLALWQVSKDDKERADLLAQTKSYREKYGELAGPSTPRGRLLDGKVKYAERDFIEARRLLAQYLDEMTPARSDLGALRLLGDILRAEQNVGGAKQQYLRILEINPRDTEAMMKLAEIEVGLTQYLAGAQLLEQVLLIEPKHPQAAAVLEQVKDVMASGKAKDPLTAALGQAQEKLIASPPDIAGAKAVIQKAAKDLKPEPRTANALANRLLVLDDREGAVELLERAVALSPDEPGLKRMLAQVKENDPVKARLDAIEGSTYPDSAKAVLRYQLYASTGNKEEAKKALAQAKELEPEGPLVISALFEQAVNDGDKVEAKRLADIAAAKDIDRVNGLIFRVRLELMEGRIREAVALAQQAVQADSLSPIHWRLLGTVRLAQGKDHYTEALAAFEKGQQIKPDDVECIKGVLRARIGLEQYVEALAIARQNLPLASGDPEFGDIWLALEGQFGDVEKAIAYRQKQFERNPSDRTNTLELAAMLVRTEKWEEARKPLDAAKAAQNDVNVVNFEAAWFAGQGKVAEARKVWDDYIASMPEKDRSLALYVTYANFLRETGQAMASLEVLRGVRNQQSPERMEIDRELGDLAFGAGDWEMAIGYYRSALKSVKEDPENKLLLRLTESLIKNAAVLAQSTKPEDAAVRLENLKEADALCERAEAVKPDPSLILLRADVATGMKDKERARALLNQAVEANPTNKIAYLKRAQILVEQNNPELLQDVKADLNQALRLDPKFAPARQMLAKILYATQQADQALALLREGVALDPTASSVRVDMIGLLMGMGRTDDAQKALEEVMKRDSSPDWRVMAGQLAEQVNEPAKTVDYYKQAWAKRKNPMLAQALANAMLRLPKPDLEGVKAVLAEPASRIETSADMLLIRASVANIEKRTDDRNADIVAAYKLLDGTNPETMLALTQKLRIMVNGNAPETVALFDLFKPAGGFPEGAALQLARTKLTDPKLKAEGLADLDTIIAASTDRAATGRSLVRGADLLYLERAYESAADVYQRGTVLLPDDASVKNNLAYTLSKHLNKHEQALPLVEAAATAEPSNPNFLDTMGTVLIALGDLKRAEATLLKARDVATTPRTQLPIYLHLVEVYLGGGNKTKADEFYGQAQRALGRDGRLKVEFEEELARVDKKMKGGR
ncbi:MAG: tetratricopeptide repeat protein [Phycisphaerales bacterium]